MEKEVTLPIKTQNIRYFGMISELVGASEEVFTSTAETVNELRKELEIKYSGLDKVTYAVAVNQLLAEDYTVIPDECEIALLPPFSGG